MSSTQDSAARLRQCYERIASHFASRNVAIEPFESVFTVFQHRQYWRPERPRVILLAESHVFTPAEELVNTVDLSGFGHPDSPRAYARFVYCVGYGEDAAVSGRVENNAGTWQFWRLFQACVTGGTDDGAFSSVLKGGTPDWRQRVRNKLSTLAEMRRRGIWLVDASVVALYTPGAAKAASAALDWAIQESWRSFWHPELAKLSGLAAVCIGRGVEMRLAGRLGGAFPAGLTVIDQPNARLSGDQHLANLRSAGNVCAVHAPVDASPS